MRDCVLLTFRCCSYSHLNGDRVPAIRPQELIVQLCGHVDEARVPSADWCQVEEEGWAGSEVVSDYGTRWWTSWFDDVSYPAGNQIRVRLRNHWSRVHCVGHNIQWQCSKVCWSNVQWQCSKVCRSNVQWQCSKVCRSNVQWQCSKVCWSCNEGSPRSSVVLD